MKKCPALPTHARCDIKHKHIILYFPMLHDDEDIVISAGVGDVINDNSDGNIQTSISQDPEEREDDGGSWRTGLCWCQDGP